MILNDLFSSCHVFIIADKIKSPCIMEKKQAKITSKPWSVGVFLWRCCSGEHKWDSQGQNTPLLHGSPHVTPSPLPSPPQAACLWSGLWRRWWRLGRLTHAEEADSWLYIPLSLLFCFLLPSIFTFLRVSISPDLFSWWLPSRRACRTVDMGFMMRRWNCVFYQPF